MCQESGELRMGPGVLDVSINFIVELTRVPKSFSGGGEMHMISPSDKFRTSPPSTEINSASNLASSLGPRLVPKEKCKKCFASNFPQTTLRSAFGPGGVGCALLCFFLYF